MIKRFVIEAVMIAVHGQLLVPNCPVEYVIPYTTIMELYEMKEGTDSIMEDSEDDTRIKSLIGEMIVFFEDPFNRKKIERALTAPWRKSAPLPINASVSFIVINASEEAQYGEQLDPIETELILTSLHENIPLLTDQLEFLEQIVHMGIPIQVYDVEDYEYALEEDSLLT